MRLGQPLAFSWRPNFGLRIYGLIHELNPLK